MDDGVLSNSQKQVVDILREEGPQSVKDLQARTNYKSRSQFIKEVLKPLMDQNIIYRDGKPKSPKALIKIRQ